VKDFKFDFDTLQWSYDHNLMTKESWNDCASHICDFISTMIGFKGSDPDKVLFWNIAHHVWEDGNLTDKSLYDTLCQEKPCNLTEDEFMLLRMSIHLLRMLPPFEECIDYNEGEDNYVD
tara:strand:- start:3048 stop:3404 length:357 start_codon:yes stop_codon:yes gene_type:complete